MARIRTVKPEFFKHEVLFEAEQETGLPLRLAYIGLWTQADREGRFLWRPRPLKLDILPYDECDFSRVLDALATRGFLVKYTDGKRDIGAIPSFHRHQVINNRESASTLPPPPENIGESDAWGTREARVGHAACGEGKGREGKGTTETTVSVLSEPAVTDRKSAGKRKPKAKGYTPEFETFWQAYPSTVGQSKPNGFKAWEKLSAADQAAALASLPAYAALLKKTDRIVKHVQGYLNGRMFESFGASISQLETPALWQTRLDSARAGGAWASYKWGPMPGKPGCRVPAALLQPGDGIDWPEQAKAA